MKFKLSSPEFDKWNGEDKALHFSLSALMSAAAALSFYMSGVVSSPVALAFAMSVFVGMAKEVKDATTEAGSGFSYKDLVADVLGSALGVSTAAALLM